MVLLARLIRMITTAVVVLIVAGIVLHVLDANASNAVVSFIYDVSGWLVTPFKGIFNLDDNKLQLALNWGLAALVYSIVGGFISTLLARAGFAAEDRMAYRRRGTTAY